MRCISAFVTLHRSLSPPSPVSSFSLLLSSPLLFSLLSSPLLSPSLCRRIHPGVSCTSWHADLEFRGRALHQHTSLKMRGEERCRGRGVLKGRSCWLGSQASHWAPRSREKLVAGAGERPIISQEGGKGGGGGLRHQRDNQPCLIRLHLISLVPHFRGCSRAPPAGAKSRRLPGWRRAGEKTRPTWSAGDCPGAAPGLQGSCGLYSLCVPHICLYLPPLLYLSLSSLSPLSATGTPPPTVICCPHATPLSTLLQGSRARAGCSSVGLSALKR